MGASHHLYDNYNNYFSLLYRACVRTDSAFDCISNDYVLILLLIELLSCPEVIIYWQRVNLRNGSDVWQANRI